MSPVGARRRLLRTALALVTGCCLVLVTACSSAFVTSTVQQEVAPAGDGPSAFNPAALPPQAQAWVQYIYEAGNMCPEAPPELIAGVIDYESSWNPNAGKGTNGAQGLGQFEPGTWATQGTDGDGDGRKDPLDPADAIVSTGHYLCSIAGLVKQQIQDHGIPGLTTPDPDVRALMLVGYNEGPGIYFAPHVCPLGGTATFDPNGMSNCRDGNGTTSYTYVDNVISRMNQYVSSAGPAELSAMRQEIVAAARSKVGYQGSANECQMFGPCEEWCALFVTWAWGQGQINFRTASVEELHNYGHQHHSSGTDFSKAQPGDALIHYDGSGGHALPYYHVSLIVQAFPDGTVTTIDGNYGNAVEFLTRYNPHNDGGLEYVSPVPGT